FIYVSSAGVERGRSEALHERMPIRFHTWYGVGKLCNEFQLRVARPCYQRGPAIVIPPAVIFGTNERRFERQCLGTIYKLCQQSCRFVFDSPEGLEAYGTSFLGSGDFGRALADSRNIKTAGTYNIAGGFCTWRELIEMMNRCAKTHASFAV